MRWQDPRTLQKEISVSKTFDRTGINKICIWLQTSADKGPHLQSAISAETHHNAIIYEKFDSVSGQEQKQFSEKTQESNQTGPPHHSDQDSYGAAQPHTL